MGAADILGRLRDRGLTLAPLPDGRILASPSDKLTDADRAQIRAHKRELLDLLQRQRPTRFYGGTAVPRPSVLDLCGLSEAEITCMVQRVNVARRAGYSLDDAEQIADRLLWRDRTLIDMHACLECARLRGSGCTARPPQQFTHGAVHELIRCPAFTPTAKD
ncbi:hypothetical protein [uncultured Sphaerotilus sp.]|uniref:hypothetical protein n=1 Tax=uncultured Sphaerotilus sp. TaxID=474984 RepID=UPI0030CA4849